MEPMVRVNNVSMCFRMAREKTENLKDYFVKFVKRQLQFTEFYALKNVSFEVMPGEAVALIGRNGGGKSTTLKTIAGVMYPTSGSVEVNGTIAPLIELGAGFDMELTARENIYLNGAVLGYSRDFMNERFDEIIEFSELQDFIDTPIKNYSSGMIARLGFAIATAIQGDILICDEILAVGDAQFQQKCHERMSQMMGGGTTVLFVSHDIEQVRKLCTRAIWLDHGKIREDGPVNEVCDHYVEAGRKKEI